MIPEYHKGQEVEVQETKDGWSKGRRWRKATIVDLWAGPMHTQSGIIEFSDTGSRIVFDASDRIRIRN
jgi:hypothetical protein